MVESRNPRYTRHGKGVGVVLWRIDPQQPAFSKPEFDGRQPGSAGGTSPPGEVYFFYTHAICFRAFCIAFTLFWWRAGPFRHATLESRMEAGHFPLHPFAACHLLFARTSATLYVVVPRLRVNILGRRGSMFLLSCVVRSTLDYCTYCTSFQWKESNGLSLQFLHSEAVFHWNLTYPLVRACVRISFPYVHLSRTLR